MAREQDHPQSPGRGRVALGGHLRVSLKEIWRRYRKKLKRCQKCFCEECVHALRVETRRLLSELDLVSTFVREDLARESCRILKKRMDAFGDLRDIQVQVLYIGKRLHAFPELDAVHEKLRRREHRLIRSGGRKVKAFKTGRLAKSIALLKKQLTARSAISEASGQGLDVIRRRVQQAFSRAVEFRSRIDPDDAATIHRARVAFKRFRYMLESVQPVLPGVRHGQLRQMQSYQTLMGEIQDVEVLRARIDKLVAKKKLKAKPMQRFRQELVRCQAALVSKYLERADQLFTFWPGPRQALVSAGASGSEGKFQPGNTAVPTGTNWRLESLPVADKDTL